MKHLDRGDTVHILYVTDGRSSRSGGYTDAEMAGIRRDETIRCQAILQDTNYTWLGLPEGGWEISELTSALVDCFQGGLPDVIYAPSSIDFHPEHIKVARGLAEFLSLHPGLGADTAIRIFQVQVPLTMTLVNLVVELDQPTIEIVSKALTAYRSQQASTNCTWRLRWYDGLRLHARSPIESFWELSLQAYRSIHEAASLAKSFRGLRINPWSDPLAYAIGQRARRRILRASRMVTM